MLRIRKTLSHMEIVKLSCMVLCVFLPLPSAMRPNCSTITSAEKVRCVWNTNATVCIPLGCCWNPKEPDPKWKCYTKSGGTCMPYRGKVCSNSINTTLLTYRHTPRFVDNRFGLLGTEQFLTLVTKVTDLFVGRDEKCRYILLNMFCQYTLQPCYQDNTVIEYCKEDCEAIFRECSGPLNQVIGAVKLQISQQVSDFLPDTGLPDCSKLKPFKYFADKPNRTCIKTGFSGFISPTAPSTESGTKPDTEPGTEPGKRNTDKNSQKDKQNAGLSPAEAPGIFIAILFLLAIILA